MRKIKIKKNSVGDSRTADRVPTINELIESNYLHAKDVEEMMEALEYEIKVRGAYHDHTKREEPYRSEFYRELCATIEGKIDFIKDGKWYTKHCKEERHHLNEYCPDDVNLIDVIEMICDCVCAGMARSGVVRPVEISSDVLQKAVKNTVDMCAKAVEIE